MVWPLGIEAYWKFGDGSGTSRLMRRLGNTGTTHGSNIWTTAAKINGGLQLGGSGSGNYVSTSFTVRRAGRSRTSAGPGSGQERKLTAFWAVVGSSNGMLIQIPSGTSTSSSGGTAQVSESH